MDYGELKEKYGGSGKEQDRPQMKSAVALLAVAALVLVAFLYYRSAKNTSSTGDVEGVLGELNSASAPLDTIGIVEYERCGELDKLDNVWTIGGCKDDISIILTLDPVNGNYMRVCGGWSDGGELLQKSPDVLKSINFKTDCDASSVRLLGEEGMKKIYNVCGKTVYMEGGCIV